MTQGDDHIGLLAAPITASFPSHEAAYQTALALERAGMLPPFGPRYAEKLAEAVRKLKDGE